MTFDGVVLIKQWTETTYQAFKEKTCVIQVEIQRECHPLRKVTSEHKEIKHRLKAIESSERISLLCFS